MTEVVERERWPVAVVGAGPAGLAAAVAAADRGVRVLLLDAGAAPGGQYWRQRGDRRLDDDRAPHAEHGGRRLRRLWAGLAEHRRAGRVGYVAGAQVWQVTRDDDGFTLRVTAAPGASPVTPVHHTRRLVLAPGGSDRQLPFPGWELPGVMAAGGVQSLLKASGTLAGRRAVVAGTGPFLLPVATGLARAGAEVVAVCEAGRPHTWLRDAPALLGVPGKLVEGAQLAGGMLRHRIPYRTSTVVARAVGGGGPDGDELDRVELVRRRPDGSLVGPSRVVTADLLAVGWGFTPAIELALQLGAATRVDGDGSLVVRTAADQATSVPGLWVAGEACGVGGATLSDIEGTRAGAAVADAARGREVRRHRGSGRIARHRRFAAAMHRHHPVPVGWSGWLEEDTLVCRCEEVPLDRVRHARTELGATDARSVKQLTRIGMGWCQGRVCGFALCSLVRGSLDGEPPGGGRPDPGQRRRRRHLRQPQRGQHLPPDRFHRRPGRPGLLRLHRGAGPPRGDGRPLDGGVVAGDRGGRARPAQP